MSELPNFSETALPDGVIIGCPWPHTIVTWPGIDGGAPKQRAATKVEHDLWRALQKADSELKIQDDANEILQRRVQELTDEIARLTSKGTGVDGIDCET